jgi:hypothetical protein
MTKINDLETKVFDNSAQEPVFKKMNVAKAEGELAEMGYKERHALQINYAWDSLKGGSSEAGK